MKKVGLFFGSYNPIHQSHLLVANQVLNNVDLDEIWFVISPHNPHKETKDLIDQNHRLDMVNLAIKDNRKFKVCTAEFGLPKPSFTIDTLDYLKDYYEDVQFSIIMGSDNVEKLPLWREYDRLNNENQFIIYHRDILNITNYMNINNKQYINNLLNMNISSTFIRNSIKEGKSIKYLVPDNVEQYINQNKLYV